LVEREREREREREQTGQYYNFPPQRQGKTEKVNESSKNEKVLFLKLSDWTWDFVAQEKTLMALLF
jgi:transposase